MFENFSISSAQLISHYKKEFYDIQRPVYIRLHAEVISIASNKTERLGFGIKPDGGTVKYTRGVSRRSNIETLYTY